MDTLKRLRKALELSRPALGKMLGLSASRINQYETEIPPSMRKKLIEIAEQNSLFSIAAELRQDPQASAVSVPASAGYPYRRTREAHELLEFILESDRQAADCILGNLKMYAEAIRGRGAPRPKRKAG